MKTKLDPQPRRIAVSFYAALVALIAMIWFMVEAAPTEKLQFKRDSDGSITYAREPSDVIYNLWFTNSAAKEIILTNTAAAGARFALFSFEDDFFALKNGTAAVPTADVTDGTGSELNPTIWAINANDTNMTVIAVTATEAAPMRGSVSFYIR